MGKPKTRPETKPQPELSAEHRDEVAAALEAEFEADLKRKAKQSQAPPAGDGDEPVEVTEEAAALVRSLESERDEAIAAKQRAQADFLNYQRRATENEKRATREGASGVVRSVLPVLDHVDMALGQALDQVTIEQLIEGVRMVRDELLKALEGHAVHMIKPESGEEFDPSKHHAVMRQLTNEQPSDTVVSVLQIGYAMGELVLRPASVSVAAPEENEAKGDQE